MKYTSPESLMGPSVPFFRLLHSCVSHQKSLTDPVLRSITPHKYPYSSPLHYVILSLHFFGLFYY